MSPIGQMLQPGQEGKKVILGTRKVQFSSGRGQKQQFWLLTHFFGYLQHLLWEQPARAHKASSTSKFFAGCSYQHLELRAVSVRANPKTEGREIWRQKVIAETPNTFTCWQLSSEVRALPQAPAISPGFATNNEETQHRVAKHT